MNKSIQILKLIWIKAAKIVRLFLWFLAACVFGLIIAWSVYYFIKPDLPPEEILDILQDLQPDLVETVSSILH